MTTKPPAGLGKEGRAFWRAMNDELTFGPHELRILRDAAAVVDTIAWLTAAMDGQDARTTGSMGQAVIAPEIAELRQQRALLAALIARLKVPELDENASKSGVFDTVSDAKRRLRVIENG